MEELAKAVAGQELCGPVARLCDVGALDFGAQHCVVEDGAPLE
jgi:hypothetical protein